MEIDIEKSVSQLAIPKNFKSQINYYQDINGFNVSSDVNKVAKTRI